MLQRTIQRLYLEMQQAIALYLQDASLYTHGL